MAIKKGAKCLFIIGMHRSGTSALTGSLNILGLPLGIELMEPNEFNPKGYFENNKIYHFNDLLLSHLGVSWNMTYLQRENWWKSGDLDPYKERLREVLEEDFSDVPVFVIKDPRISVLLPFWKEVIRSMGVSAQYVIMLRHPVEIQQSLARREGYQAPKTHLLWSDHMLKAEHYTRDGDRLMLEFDNFLSSPCQALSWINEELKLGFADDLVRAKEEIMEFIEPDLRHHRNSAAQVIKEEYQALWDLCKGGGPGLLKEREKIARFDEFFKTHLSIFRQFLQPVWRDASELAREVLNPFSASVSEDLPTMLESIRLAQSETEQQYCRREVEFKREIERLQHDLFTLNSEIEGLKTDLSNLSIEYDRLQRRSDQASTELESHRAEIQQLRVQIAAKERDISDAKDVLTQHEETISGLKEEVVSHTEEINLYVEEIEKLKAINDDQKDRIVQGSSAIESLKNEVHVQKVNSMHHQRGKERLQNDLHDLQTSWTYRIGRFLTSPGHWMYKSMAVRKFLSTAAWGLRALKYFVTNPIQFLGDFRRGEVMQTLLAFRDSHRHQRPLDEQLKNSLIRQHVVKGAPPRRMQVLFVSPNLPDHDASSGGKRATEMLRLLAEKYDAYIYSPGEGEDKYVRKLISVGVTILGVERVDQIPQVLPHVDTIIFAWYYVFYSCEELVDLYPNAKIIADSVDVHWIREERSLGERQGLTAEAVMSNKKREIAVYKKADIIWTVTEPDKKAVLKEIPDADIRVVSNIHSIEKSHFVPAREKAILFFGGYQHYPNIKAVRTLATKIFPKIRAAVPNTKLLIAGSKAPDEIKQLGELTGVEYIGFVEDSDVSDLYDRAALTIVPLFSGAGIKGKICEAIAHRLPVITNQVGNEGIGLEHESEALLAEEPQEMANFAIGLLKNEYPLELMTSKAQHRLMPIVGPSAVKASMVRSISPGIAVCIVTWNRKELLQLCLESILKNTEYPNFKVLVHSNACTDDTRRYLQEVSRQENRIEPILSDKNEVFVLPNNNMMQLYPEYDVVLLNNDTTVAPGWLTALYRAAYLSSDIGVAGSKVLYPDGTLQEFGSELYEDGTGRNIGKGDSPDNEKYQLPKYVGYVSGCAMYIKRSTIERIGVFDERFHPCYCEDSDYCYSAWQQGLKTIVTPHSIVYHHEGATSGTDTSSGLKAYQGINMKKFLTKHKDQLTRINSEISTLVTQKEDFLGKINTSARKKYEDSFGKDILAGTQCIIDSRIADYESFTKYREEMTPAYKRREQIENRLYQYSLLDFDLYGYNPMIGREVSYRIHMPELDGSNITSRKPNYRETVICPETKTNSRVRNMAIQLNKILETYEKNAKLYCTEQRTPFYNYYQKQLVNIQGSEYLRSGFKSGRLYNGFRHEKLHDLSFGDHEFEIIVSLDALQYVFDYRRALAEFYRCLKPGGSILMTVPFDLNQERHLVRSSIDKQGVVKHHETPLYYSNHIHKEQELLCYHHFGWELLDRMREVGFSAVNVHFGWDLHKGILGRDMHWIMGKKE